MSKVPTVMYKGHKIEISNLAKEKVIYDEKEVSTKVTVAGGTHIFTVNEDGKPIQYEVTLGVRWHWMSNWHEVRRNGVLIFTDR